MRQHEITDNDAFVGTTAKPRAGKVETKLPCGATIKAEQNQQFRTQWQVVVFNDIGKQVASFGLLVRPDNANAIHNFLRKIVHLTPGIEDKT